MKHTALIPFVCAAGLLAHAADLPMTRDSTSLARLAGTWRIAYEDLALGEVNGTATVREDGRAITVVLRHPRTNRDHRLNASSIREDAGEFVIVLEGESPAAESLLPDEATRTQAARADSEAADRTTEQAVRDTNASLQRLRSAAARSGAAVPAPIQINPVPLPLIPAPVGPLNETALAGISTPPPASTHIEVRANATALAIRVGDFVGEIALKPRKPADTRRVELRLRLEKRTDGAAPIEALAGSWRYAADPATRRDGAGGGRVGYFRRDQDNPNQPVQSAAEIWSRDLPMPHLRFFAQCAEGLKPLDALYLGVPTIVEAVFEQPDSHDTIIVSVENGPGNVRLIAKRDPENFRRFTSEVFVPGTNAERRQQTP